VKHPHYHAHHVLFLAGCCLTLVQWLFFFTFFLSCSDNEGLLLLTTGLKVFWMFFLFPIVQITPVTATCFLLTYSPSPWFAVIFSALPFNATLVPRFVFFSLDCRILWISFERFASFLFPTPIFKLRSPFAPRLGRCKHSPRATDIAPPFSPHYVLLYWGTLTSHHNDPWLASISAWRRHSPKHRPFFPLLFAKRNDAASLFSGGVSMAISSFPPISIL